MGCSRGKVASLSKPHRAEEGWDVVGGRSIALVNHTGNPGAREGWGSLLAVIKGKGAVIQIKSSNNR